MDSDCYVKKGGGFYSWDPSGPWSTFLEHGLHERDGYFRWAIHCNRPEFDHILFNHARDSGAEVYEGMPVHAVSREDGITRLISASMARPKPASSSTVPAGPAIPRSPASARSCPTIGISRSGTPCRRKAATSLPGDWNIFREKDLSPVGSLAFEDGWFWYIPVPKLIQGKRVVTHSLGVVGD